MPLKLLADAAGTSVTTNQCVGHLSDACGISTVSIDSMNRLHQEATIKQSDEGIADIFVGAGSTKRFLPAG